MNKIRIEHKDSLTPFGAHYVVMADHSLITSEGKAQGSDDPMPVQHVALNFEALTDYLVHHMAAFETGGGSVNIDGFVLPVKTAARIYIDAYASVLGNCGVSPNLAKIRQELCGKCIGSQAAAPEFTADPAPAIAVPGIEQPQVETGPATALNKGA